MEGGVQRVGGLVRQVGTFERYSGWAFEAGEGWKTRATSQDQEPRPR